MGWVMGRFVGIYISKKKNGGMNQEDGTLVVVVGGRGGRPRSLVWITPPFFSSLLLLLLLPESPESALAGFFFFSFPFVYCPLLDTTATHRYETRSRLPFVFKLLYFPGLLKVAVVGDSR